MKSLLLPSLRAIVAMATLALPLLPATAHAVYKYEYTSNPVAVTFTPLFDTDVLSPYTVDSVLIATVYSPTALIAGSGLTAGLSFSLVQSVDPGNPIQFPYPNPVHPAECPLGCGSVTDPYDTGVFSIGAVDAAGLPTVWNMAIDFSYFAPTGREFTRYYASSNQLDSVSGGYEGFVTFAGSLAGRPGNWTVSVVPEPESYAMLLAGLGVIGFVARKRLPWQRPVI